MFKLVLSLVVLCFVASTFSQTFQYSHGWTNGKRALNGYIDYEVPEIYGVPQYYDHKLEKCILQLQNLLGSSPLASTGGQMMPSPQNNGNNK